jgi:ubiquitin carboxyl-terminal hydrolase L5
VFTSLIRKLGIRNLELVEMYDIEPWAVDHLNPRGLIFCFLWRKDSHCPAEFVDPAAERVWFANQLSDDACASHAILNVLLNCPDIEHLDGGAIFSFSSIRKGMFTNVVRARVLTGEDVGKEAAIKIARSQEFMCVSIIILGLSVDSL